MTISAVRDVDGAVIAGWCELPVSRRPHRPARELLAQAVAGAIAHAGIVPSEVDGFAVGGFTLGPDHAVDLALRLGLRVQWLSPQDPGGSGALNGVLGAARAVLAGDAEVVVCAAADTTDPASLARLNATFSTSFAEALAPIGAASAPVVFAFVQNEHARRTGTSREDLGRVAAAQRRCASRNPVAMFRAPLSVPQYLDAPAVAEPIGLYDCVYPGSGAAAVVVMSEDRARRIRRPVAHLRAGFSVHGHGSRAAMTFGWREHAAALYDACGLGPRDLSVLELYDDFPVMVAIQLDELGLLGGGGLRAFLDRESHGVAGAVPFNTGGGMLNIGQAGGAGGFVPLVQAARQVTHQAGDTQVAGASAALATGLGMIDQDGPQSVGALVMSRPGVGRA
ncbi:thiolase family protein [Xylanimonas allomyrinae]|uniref:Thiolase family protein n=1 Tax=Xylanimonas allomyrinae TaxID=2509459 RepID=A0A4P6EKE1_9MICO|nr:thiolase family protein [Xylanimonas allomyrinae]QAY62586.1 thiolase family protein [Xylanimonas allomyrinae]